MLDTKLNIKLYSYDELSEEAKEKVKKWYLNDPILVDVFYQDTLIYLQEDFPNSDLNVQFSLSYCQGDGLNIYGTLDFNDIISKLKTNYSEKEIKTLKHYIADMYGGIELSKNDSCHYCYSFKQYDENYIPVVIDRIHDACYYYRNFNEKIIEDFLIDVFDYMEELDDKYESKGYNFLYDVNDETLSEFCEANGYLFDEDGNFEKSFCAFDFIS